MPTPAEVQRFAAALKARTAGRLTEARSLFGSLIPGHQEATIRLLVATMLPLVYESHADMLRRREQAIDELSRLQRSGMSVDLSNQLGVPWMEITYQGMNDREPQRLLAGLQRAPQPALPAPPPRAGHRRIRLGLASTYFREHTIGKLMRGLVPNISRDDFTVTIFMMGHPKDEIAEFCRASCDAYVHLPADVTAARDAILGQKLDILFYLDIGMEPTTFTLAHSRLAPVQCTTWGHPDTTGIDTIDYFISSEAMETPDGQQYYTEKLVRLKDLAIYYYRPAVSGAPIRRSEFGLPETGTLYGSLQTLTKFHPDFDDLLAQILRRDPGGVLVLLAGNFPEMTDALTNRFRRTMPDVVNRVRFMPRMDLPRFLRLNASMDVMLDPLHFGGGNTSYEALALGIPIVTWPSPFLRGRIAYAQYKAINVLDCVARDFKQYVELAVRLGLDRDWRKAMREKILASNSVLYENTAGLRQLEDFFRSVAAR